VSWFVNAPRLTDSGNPVPPDTAGVSIVLWAVIVDAGLPVWRLAAVARV
jgi:hypothetical protein